MKNIIKILLQTHTNKTLKNISIKIKTEKHAHKNLEKHYYKNKMGETHKQILKFHTTFIKD